MSAEQIFEERNSNSVSELSTTFIMTGKVQPFLTSESFKNNLYQHKIKSDSSRIFHT